MNRRHTAMLAFVAVLASGGLAVCAQASTSDTTRATVEKQGVLPPLSITASRHSTRLPRTYVQHRMLALSTAEMIYMHESLVGSLVSITPAAVPAPPVVPHRRQAPPAVQK